MADLKATATKLGLPFGSRLSTYNSRRAQELGKWAEAENRGDAFHRLAFEAYFVKGYNIAKMEVLKNLAVSAGLDASMAETVLTEGRYGPAVDADWQRSRAMGITAVPTFQMGTQRLVGAQRYAVLEKMMRNHQLFSSSTKSG